jgi:AcrR family transcriptional regulator
LVNVSVPSPDPEHSGPLTTRTGDGASGSAVRLAPTTERGRRTRAALLDASRRVFGRLGFVNTKISDIAAEAGVAQGSFYNYFDSKEQIFAEFIAGVISEVLARTAHGGAGQAVFERVSFTIEQYVVAYWPIAGALAALDEAAAMYPQFRELANDNRALFVARAERGIRRLQHTGEADPTIDPHVAAGALVAMTHNFVGTVWLTSQDMPGDVVIRTLATIWVRGIGAELPPDSDRQHD